MALRFGVRRFGRARTPDPDRPGTVYRATPGFRLRPDDEPPALTSPAPHAPGPVAHAPGPVPHAPGPAPGPAPDASAPFTTGGAGFGLPDKGGRRPHRRVRARRVVGLLLTLAVLYPMILGVLAWTSLQKVSAFPSSARPDGAPGTTYLVVGSDSREDLSREERARLGTGAATGVRTDTIMLLQAHGFGGSAVLVSIPRDSYVTIPGHGKNKINAAYALGGPKLLIATVEQATGIKVDRFVMTGLGGFAGVVDAMGGVRLCPKRAMKDAKAHLDVAKGCQTMDGKTALGYARARYSDPLGDLGRVQRQREVLAAIANKLMSPSVLLVPWRAGPAAVAGGNALTVDSTTMPWSLAQFVLGMRSVTGDKGVTLTVPIGNPSVQTSVGEVVTWDSAKAQKLFTAMRADDLATIKKLAG